MSHHAKYTMDGIAAAAAFSSFFGWLPPIASILSIIWLSIQIYEWARKKFKQ